MALKFWKRRSYFEKLQSQAFRAGVTPRTKESINWFRKSLKKVKNINNKKLLKDSALTKVAKPKPGSMYMYFYDPKHKDTLPYYDRFPLIIMVGKAKNGFIGLNLHYLPPILRAKFFDRLTEFTSNNKYDETTKIRLTYDFLKNSAKLKEFQPCYKHYLTKHVISRIVEVQAPEWEVALFMPTEKFEKSSKSKVWNKSRKLIS